MSEMKKNIDFVERSKYSIDNKTQHECKNCGSGVQTVRKSSKDECQEWYCDDCIKSAYEDIREFSCNLHTKNEKRVLKYDLIEIIGNSICKWNIHICIRQSSYI